MTKKIQLVYILVLLSFMGCASTEKKPKHREISLNLTYFGSIESRLDDIKYDFLVGNTMVQGKLGGIARIYPELKNVSKKKNTIKIYTGNLIGDDLYQKLFRGEPEVDFLNRMEIDMFSLAEKDFGLEIKTKANLYRGLSDKLVSSNIKLDSQIKELGYKNGWKPYYIKDIDGEKIAFLSLMDEKLKEPGIYVEDSLKSAKRYVKKLSELDINKIIVISNFKTHNLNKFIENSVGIDLVINKTKLYKFDNFLEKSMMD